MSLSPGTRLAHFEVIAPIGAGGMGEVYKARDTRLDRTVAIKVLPEHLAESPERRARFEREAKAISQLNHPHICTLYDVGEQDGIDFIVMEYIEGETLAERLGKGALTTHQALAYGAQIADGLDMAHRSGIVHRDLKPGNVMLTASGVKLLDFGLAKLSKGQAARESSDAPTRQRDLTEEKALLGTLRYMAPEQLEGRQADTRTDVFAFGALLYEMVTGRRAFQGDSQASLISAIMSSEPPAPATLASASPPALDHVIQTCLSKSADERWQSCADIRRQLEWIAQNPSFAKPATTRVERSASLVWKAAAAAMTVVAAATLWMGNRTPPRASRQVVRSTIELPETGSLAPGARSSLLALSPDGSFVSYTSADLTSLLSLGLSRLYLRRMDELNAEPIPGTDGAETPFFSPSGEWLGFVDEANGEMKKLALSGGAPTVICDASNVRGASWGPDGTIVFTASATGGLLRVPASGGEPQPLTTLTPGEKSHRHPQVLPDGTHVLFTISTNDRLSFDDASIALASLDSGQYRVLIEGGTGARYVSSGHIVYARAGSLLAVPFDLEALEIRGTAVPVVENVSLDWSFGAADFDVSRGGLLVYAPGSRPGQTNHLKWVHRDGSETSLSEQSLYGSAGFNPSLSPDGTKIAIQVSGATDQIWVSDIQRGTWSPLTHEWDNIAPTWSPDGGQITFLSNRQGFYNLYRQEADGSAPAERLRSTDRVQWSQPSWSPDGRYLAFAEGDSINNLDVWVWQRDAGEATKVVSSRFTEHQPRFSPDGHWLAYVSNESGINQVYVQRHPDPRDRRQISTGGGTLPEWSSDGREIFYLWDDQLFSVDVTTEPAFRAGQPEVRYEGKFWGFDVAPNGDLVIVEPLVQTLTSELHVVNNWFTELKRLVPTDN